MRCVDVPPPALGAGRMAEVFPPSLRVGRKNQILPCFDTRVASAAGLGAPKGPRQPPFRVESTVVVTCSNRFESMT